MLHLLKLVNLFLSPRDLTSVEAPWCETYETPKLPTSVLFGSSSPGHWHGPTLQEALHLGPKNTPCDRGSLLDYMGNMLGKNGKKGQCIASVFRVFCFFLGGRRGVWVQLEVDKKMLNGRGEEMGGKTSRATRYRGTI